MPDQKPSPLNTFSVLFGIIGIIIGLLIGIAAVKLLPQKNGDTQVMVDNKATEDNPIFTSQFATINGKITSIDETSLTVQSGVNTSKFNLNQPIFISKPSSLSRPASPSGDIKIVPLNEFATLNLQKIAGEYKVTTISLLPPTGIPPVIPSDFPLSSPPAQ